MPPGIVTESVAACETSAAGGSFTIWRRGRECVKLAAYERHGMVFELGCASAIGQPEDVACVQHRLRQWSR
jgi:hypothetical protein